MYVSESTHLETTAMIRNAPEKGRRKTYPIDSCAVTEYKFYKFVRLVYVELLIRSNLQTSHLLQH